MKVFQLAHKESDMSTLIGCFESFGKRALKDLSDSCLQDRKRERLGHKVCRPELQRFHLIHLCISCRQHEKGHVPVLPDLRAQVIPAAVRQVAVQQDKIIPALLQLLHALPLRPGARRLTAVHRKRKSKPLPEVFIILYDQYSAHMILLTDSYTTASIKVLSPILISFTPISFFLLKLKLSIYPSFR